MTYAIDSKDNVYVLQEVVDCLYVTDGINEEEIYYDSVYDQNGHRVNGNVVMETGIRLRKMEYV